MRLLWFSATPECHSAYGTQTKYMVRWLRDLGHEVMIATKHPYGLPYHYWEGCPIFEGCNIPVTNRMVENEKIDWVISLFDVWTLQMPFKNWMAWIPIDTEIVSQQLIDALKDSQGQIALSKHGLKELKKHGFTPFYSPHGVDTDIFKPRPDEGLDLRKNLGWSKDDFVVGSVGMNYADDRKGYVPLLQAFKDFHKKHSDARLYLHTKAFGKKGVPYAAIAKNLGILDGVVGWPDQDGYHLMRYQDDVMPGVYSAFDVFCLPTRGEGFGVPTIEAQSCGVPVIVTENTTGPELCKQGWLIETDTDDLVWTGLKTWRLTPKPSNILWMLEAAYHVRDKLKKGGRLAREMVKKEYDWKVIWEKHWTPILKLMEIGVQKRKENENKAKT